MTIPSIHLCLFARAPRAGHCKTRLIPALGPRGAAALQARLCRQAVVRARATGATVALWCAPGPGHASFSALRRQHGVHLRRQPRGDLGARMSTALRHPPPGTRGVLVVGTDAPGLTTAHLRAAMAALDGPAQAVMLTAEDGGFVAIGSTAPVHLRGVNWSSGREARQTLHRLRSQGLEVRILAGFSDLDTPRDLRRARQRGDLPRALFPAGEKPAK
jgi:uncharacterized protein